MKKEKLLTKNKNNETTVKKENSENMNLKSKLGLYISIILDFLLNYHRIILFCSMFIIIILNVLKDKNNIKQNQKNNNKYENDIKMKILLKKVNHYIFLCNKGFLLNRIKKSSKNPKITAVTASYNSEKTIKAAIRSIQNQDMTDIEIVIVDDASTDNSLKVLNKLKKQDPRIKIYKNKKNMGPLFSKSLGVLKAKGKYIMQLDSDDLFINKKIFNICYEEAEKNNIDILEFSGFRSKTKYLNTSEVPRIPRYLRFKQNNITITQPELSNFIYRKNDTRIVQLIDGYLWGKCIKTDIFKKALDILGKDIYTQKIFYGDDRIVNFILFRVANSFKYIKEFGIIYYNTANSILNSKRILRNCHDELFNIMSIFNLTQNSSDSEIAAFEIRSRWKKLIVPGLNRNNSIYARSLFNKIIKSKFISKKSKNIIYNLWKNRKKKKLLI